MTVLVWLLRRLVFALNTLAVLSAVLMTCMVFLATIMRYFFGSPLIYSDEFVGILFICMAFFAMPVALLQRRHIAVDLIVRKAPHPLRAVFEIIAVLIFICFAVVFIYNAFDFADFSRQIGARSDIGGLLLWPWMMIMPASFTIGILVALIQLLDAIRVLVGLAPIAEENIPRNDERRLEGHL